MPDFNAPAPTAQQPAAEAPAFDPMAYIQAAAAQPPAAPAAPAAAQPPAAPNTNEVPWWASQPAAQPQQPPAQPPPAQPPPAQQPPVPSYMQQQPAAQPQTAWFDPTSVKDFGLSHDEATRFAQSLPVIERVVNAKLAAMEAATRAQVGNIAQQFDARIGSATQDADLVFSTQIDNAINDLPQLTSDPRWQAYLAHRPPMTGSNVQTLITNAYNNRDIRALAEIANNFRQTVGQQPQAPTALSTTSQYNNAAPAHQAPKQQLPMSAHTRATNDFVRGRITKVQFDAIDAQYVAAQAENRIDYNA